MADTRNPKKNMGLSSIRSPFLRDSARAGLVAALALVVAGCGWWSGEARKEERLRGCPNAGILTDAERMTEYREGSGRDITDVAYTWELLDAVADCSYSGSTIDVDYALSMSVSVGPAATRSVVSAPIFVAVTRAGESVLQKTTFDAEVEFEPGQRTAVYTRTFKGLEFEVGEDNGALYDIVLGFQLTPAQVNENRARARY
ncbi:hypothetical protein [Pyruvatibacter sp.]|uniref:hypothetical protein n=1 Tax=Pyruvatibacter sp. TaxID=1981328 RepID=UPI0032654E4A